MVASPSVDDGQSPFAGSPTFPRTPAPRGSNSTITGIRRRRSDSAPLPVVASPATTVSTPELYQPGQGNDDSPSISNGASGSMLGEDEDHDLEEDDEFLDDGDEEYDDEDDLGGEAGGEDIDALRLGSMFSGGDEDVDGSDGEIGIVREEEDLLAGFRKDGFIEEEGEEDGEESGVVVGSKGLGIGEDPVVEGGERLK